MTKQDEIAELYAEIVNDIRGFINAEMNRVADARVAVEVPLFAKNVATSVANNVWHSATVFASSLAENILAVVLHNFEQCTTDEIASMISKRTES